MTQIKQSEVMQPGLKVLADMWHRNRGDNRVRVARVYRLSHMRSGENSVEFILTRYENRFHVAMSSILRIEGEGYELTFTEVCRDTRRDEGKMILDWFASEGAVEHGG